MSTVTHPRPRNGAQLIVAPDAKALALTAAEEIVAVANAAVERSGTFTIALSGGPAPGPVLELLADRSEPFYDRFPWQATHFFWGDERHVPPDHPDSNFRLAYDKMLSKVPVREENVHRVKTELADAAEAATRYEASIRRHFRLGEGDFPRFDLMWQGLGENGHTASLFPGTPALQVYDRIAVANWVEKLGAHRITMTYPVLNNAAVVLFLVSGKSTAEAVKEVLFGPPISTPLPAQLVAPKSGRLVWLLDRNAASRLPEH